MLTLKFRSKLWLYPGPGGWHFITLPSKHAKEIKSFAAGVKRGWGSLPVTVTIGGTTWKTSLFPERKSRSYVLPIKADVRKREELAVGDSVALMLELRV